MKEVSRKYLYIERPYIFRGLKDIFIPQDLKNMILLKISRENVLLIYPEVRYDKIIILRRPYLITHKEYNSEDDEWIYIKNTEIFRCKKSGSCEQLINIKNPNRYVYHMFLRYLVEEDPERKEVKIYDLRDNREILSINKIDHIKTVDFGKTGFMLLKIKGRPHIFINEKLFEINEYCISENVGEALVGIRSGRKIYVFYGHNYWRYNMYESYGKRISSCSSGQNIGSVVIDDEKTLALDLDSGVEIPQRVRPIKNLKDKILLLNLDTKWLMIYTDYGIRYLTKIDNKNSKISFIGFLQDFIILRIDNEVKMFLNTYLRTIDRVKDDQLISLSKDLLIMDEGDRLKTYSLNDFTKKYYPKKNSIECVGIDNKIYCLERYKGFIYELDLNESQSIMIGEIFEDRYVRLTNYPIDATDLEVIRGVKIERDGEIIILPKNPIDSDEIKIKIDLVLSTTLINQTVRGFNKIVEIDDPKIIYSRKGLSRKCLDKPLFRTKIIFSSEEAKYYKYLLELRDNENKILYKTLVSEKELDDNNMLTACIDLDLRNISSDKLTARLYVVEEPEEYIDNKKILDVKNVSFEQRDIEFHYEDLNDQIKIHIIDPVDKTKKAEIYIECNEKNYKIGEYEDLDNIIISKDVIKNICNENFRISLWTYDDEFIWGFSGKIILDEDVYKKIESLLQRLRLYSNERIIENYDKIILPRTSYLYIKTSKDTYYKYVSYEKDVYIDLLKKGDNLIKLSEKALIYGGVLEVFDGIHREILMLRPIDFSEQILNAIKQSKILFNVIYSRRS